MSNKELMKANIQKISESGSRIYEKIKKDYDPKEKGKFLAIEIESEDVFIGSSSMEVLERAKEKYPDKIFYVVKIGYDSIETIAKKILGGI